MTNRDITILYPPGLPFSEMKQRPQQLCIELAKLGYKVIFGQSLMDLSQRTVYLPTGPYIKDTEEHPNLKLCYDVGRYAMEHDEETIIMYVSSGPHHVWSDRVQPYALIYDECDNFVVHEARAKTACVKADRIIYSAENLLNILKNRRKDRPEIAGSMTHVPNACDFEHWDLPMKTDEEFSPPYRVLFVGALAYWLDYDYIIEVVRSLPQCEFWFIGARFDYSTETRPHVSVLLASPNVHLIQHIYYKDLPFFVQDADVFWVPFDVTSRNIDFGSAGACPVSSITQYADPIKFWEYLATGKPIVFTPMDTLTKLMATINGSDYNLTCASTPEEAKAAIIDYIDFAKLGDVRRRAEYNKWLARGHTWKHSAALLDDVIQNVLTSNLEMERTVRAEIARTRRSIESDRPVFVSIHEPTEEKELL